MPRFKIGDRVQLVGDIAGFYPCIVGVVVKGGSYLDKAADVHSRARTPYKPRWQLTDPVFPKSKWWLRDGPHIGFRVVREE